MTYTDGLLLKHYQNQFNTLSDLRISELGALTIPAVGDLIPVTDISDISENASGKTKSITYGIFVGIPTKETPSGAFDGSNLTYTLAHTPIANTLDLVVQGQVFTEGVSADYTLSGTTLTLVTALPKNFAGTFIAKYRYSS